MNESFEQIVEKYTREIINKHSEILENFYKAYAAELASLDKDFSLDDICLIEQEPNFRENCLIRRYWFEFRPKFNEINE